MDHGALIGAPWVSLSLRAREIRLGRGAVASKCPAFPPPTRYRPGTPSFWAKTGTHHGLLGTKLHSRIKPAEGKTKAISCPPSVEKLSSTILVPGAPWRLLI